MRKTIIFFVIFIIGLVIAFIVIKRESDYAINNEKMVPVLDEEEFIPIRHTYKDGVHKVSGILTLPSPCYKLEAGVVVMESYPEQVRIDLETPIVRSVCAQVLQDEYFELTFNASDQAVISGYVNDIQVKLIESDDTND